MRKSGHAVFMTKSQLPRLIHNFCFKLCSFLRLFFWMIKTERDSHIIGKVSDFFYAQATSIEGVFEGKMM